MFFDYDYFCGANTVVEIDGIIATEAAAITYQINESKVPLYGYSSRFFNAIARGQVLVQGSLVVNFIHHDYLFQLIESAKNSAIDLNQGPFTNPQTLEQDPLLKQELLEQGIDLLQETALLESIKSQRWDQANPGTLRRYVVAHNLHDREDSCDIKITFGERSSQNGYNGKRNRVLTDVFFTGHGMPIQIDENVIVESYSFIARDVMFLQNPTIPTISFSPPDTGLTLDGSKIPVGTTNPEGETITYTWDQGSLYRNSTDGTGALQLPWFQNH